MKELGRDDYEGTLSIITSLLALILTALIILIRLGFDENFNLYFRILGLSFFFLNIDVLDKKKNTRIFKNTSVIIFVLTVVLFFFIDPHPFIGLFFSATGYLLLVINFFFVVGRRRVNILCPLLILIIVLYFGLYVFSVFYTGFLNPFFVESLFKGGHIDTLYHASISQMLKTYKVVSTGVDGLNYTNYHFGSHLIAASLSKLMEISVISYYQFGFPVIMFPLFFKALMNFVVTLPGKEEWEGRKLWWLGVLVFFAGFIGFLNYDGVQKISLRALIGYQFIYTSESYLVSLIFLFAWLTVLISYLRKELEETSRNVNLVIVEMLVLFAASSICKISTGYLLFCLTEYLFIRLGWYKSMRMVILNFIFALGAFFLYKISNDPIDGEGGMYFFQLVNDVSKAPLLWFFVLHFFWTINVIIFYVFFSGLRTRQEFIAAFRKQTTLLVEIPIILSICGLIPGNILYLFSRDGVYFSEVQNWVSLATLIYLCMFRSCSSERMINFLRKNIIVISTILSIAYIDHLFERTINLSPVFSFAPILMAFTWLSIERLSPWMKVLLWIISLTSILGEINHNVNTLSRRLLKNSNDLRASLLNSESCNVNYFSLPDVSSVRKLRAANFEVDSLFQLNKRLFEIDKMPLARKRQTMIFLKSSRRYLTAFSCQAVPFVLPAITGVVEFHGLEPYDRCENFGFGFEHFKWYSYLEKQTTSLDDVILAVQKMKYKQLIVVDADKYSIHWVDL